MKTSGLLNRDIDDITNRKITMLNNLKCDVILHTEKDDITIPWDHIKFIDCKRDYVAELGERYFIMLIMGLGDFVYDVYPFRNNLEATLKFKTIDSNGEPTEFQDTYKCILSNSHKGMDVPGLIATPKEVLNQGEIFTLNIECISRTLEALINIPANCNISDVKVEDALYYVIQQSINKNKPTIDGQSVNLIFDITPPHNQLKYTKISTLNTDYTNLTMLRFPTYLQNNYGVYNGGISTFLQKVKIENDFKDVISIYPTYDYSAYNDPSVKNKICFYLPMVGTSDLSEYSFFRDGDVIKAIATTDSFNYDRGEDSIRSSGTEVVFTHPKSLLNQSGLETDGEKELYFDRNKLANITTIHKTSDGTQNVKYVGINGNAYVIRSDMLIASAIGFEITWNNGIWHEITPGMPICILRETKQDGIITYYGKIIGLYMSFDKTKNSSIVKISAIARKEENNESN